MDLLVQLIKKIFYSIVAAGFLFLIYGCSAKSFMLGGGEILAALQEKPSMELVLDRINTAASAMAIAEVVFNYIPISDESTWPKEINGISVNDFEPVIRALALDGAYAAHGGSISPIKAGIVQVQNILYDIPPDMYSAEGTCYKKGESTIINGYYYKVISANKVIKKDNPTKAELNKAIDEAAKNIFVSYPCKNSGTFPKRMGKLSQKLQVGGRTYPSIMAALFKILPNGKDLREIYKDYDRIKKKIIDTADDIALFEKDKTRLEKKEKVYSRFKSISQINEQILVKRKEVEELKSDLIEKTNILKLTLDSIREHKGEVTDPKDLKTLANIVEACKAVNSFIGCAITLSVISLSKSPDSLKNVSDEFQRISQIQGTQAVYLPLRLARLRFNIGNIVDNIRIISAVLDNQASLSVKIYNVIESLINITAI
ncbi:MAG: hypothetical protein HQK76_10475 [Desulfobacterales bacterium]|nr:hypothetical protein [Desulfobacterales bacterium]